MRTEKHAYKKGRRGHLCLPLPEALPGPKGKGWDIIEEIDSPYTDNVKRKIGIPMGESDKATFTRAHELAHAHFSPATPVLKDIDPHIVNAVEDGRINQILLNSGIDTTCSDAEQMKRLVSICERSDASDPVKVRYLTLLSTSLMGTANSTVFGAAVKRSKGISKDVKDYTSEILRVVYHMFDRHTIDLKEFSTTKDIAKKLQEIFKAVSDAKDAETTPLLKDMDIKESERHDYRTEPIGELLKDFIRDMSYTKRTNKWGTMKIHKPPLSIRLSPKVYGRKFRATEEGSFFKAPHRLLGDGKVFAEKRKIPGASILIDCSGSMHMTQKDLMAILNIAPASVIALYGADSSTGTLRIVANKGQRAANKYLNSPGSANVIDGPALKWLATQPEPRIWICDGYVTGIGDQEATNLTLEAKIISKKNRIIRIRNVYETIEKLKARRMLKKKK